MVEVGIRTAPRQLADLSRRLQQAERRDLRRELYAGLNRATLPMRKAAKERMRARLPHRGGLNRKAAAARMSTKRRNAAARGEVTLKIVVTNGRNHIDSRRLDAGMIRHPVFGRRNSWVGQHVPARTITGAFEDHRDDVRRGIEEALDRVAAKIDGKRTL